MTRSSTVNSEQHHGTQVQGDNRLPVLAAEIKASHEAAVAAQVTAMEHAVQCGNLLTEAKQALPHGEWLPWLEQNCDMSVRTAQTYMRIARRLPELEDSNTQRVAHLSCREAIDLVSGTAAKLHALEPAKKAKALDMIDQGMTPSRAVLRARIDNSDIFRVAPTLVPSNGDDRKVRVLAQKDERRVRVVVGPNEAGLKLPERLAAMNGAPEWKSYDTDAAELCEEADELERRAKELREDAKAIKELKQDNQRAFLDATHGPAYHFIETYDYALDEETWARFAETRTPQEVADFIKQNGCPIDHRGWWGDIRLSPFSANNMTPSGGGWDGIGSPDWLLKIFPEFEAAADAERLDLITTAESDEAFMRKHCREASEAYRRALVEAGYRLETCCLTATSYSDLVENAQRSEKF